MSLPLLYRRVLAALVLTLAAFLIGYATATLRPDFAEKSAAAVQAATRSKIWADREAQNERSRSSLKQLIDHLQSESGYRDLLQKLIAWSKTDPAAALDFVRRYLAREHRNDALSKILADWAARDPSAAWSWTTQKLPNDYTHYDAVLAAVGKTDPATAWRFAAELAAQKPAEFAQTLYVSALRGPISTGNYAEAARLIAAVDLPPGQHPYDLSSMLAGAWGLYEPEAAADWVASLPDDGSNQRAQALVSLGVSWSKSDPQGAANFAAQLPSGTARQNMLAVALNSWAVSDPEHVGEWLLQYQQHADFDRVVQQVATTPKMADANVGMAIGWADTIISEPIRIQSLEKIVDRWMKRDPDAAAGYLRNSSDLSPETLDRLRAYFHGAEQK